MGREGWHCDLASKRPVAITITPAARPTRPAASAAAAQADSFNGIWKGCEGALIEARRVVRPGGLVGFTFWGAPKRLGLMPYFATVVELSPADHVSATINQGDTGQVGLG